MNPRFHHQEGGFTLLKTRKKTEIRVTRAEVGLSLKPFIWPVCAANPGQVLLNPEIIGKLICRRSLHPVDEEIVKPTIYRCFRLTMSNTWSTIGLSRRGREVLDVAPSLMDSVFWGAAAIESFRRERRRGRARAWPGAIFSR